MEFLLFDLIQSGIGRLYLGVRYRKKERIAELLAEKYEGSYAKAGSLFLLNSFAVMFGLLLFAFLAAVIYRAFK